MYLRVGAMGEYHVKFLRLATMILDYVQHPEFSRILLYEIGLFIYLFIYLFCAQAEFLTST